MNPKMLVLAARLAAAPAATALAQPAPPPPPAAPAGPGGGPHAGPHAGMAGRPHGGMAMRMFPSMSEAGRAIVREAMMAGGDRRAEREKVEAAREKMLTALSADRLDVAAVKRAMDEERSLAEASREARQAAMLAAFQKLSVEDRKAFVTDSRAMKQRMGQRMEGLRQRWRERRGHGAPQPPAPPAPPADMEMLPL